MEDHIRAIIHNNNLNIYEKCEAIEDYTKGTEYDNDLRYNIACALSSDSSKEYFEWHNSHKS